MAAARPEAANPPEGEAWTVDRLREILALAGAPL
jgi:hypothetical protein